MCTLRSRTATEFSKFKQNDIANTLECCCILKTTNFLPLVAPPPIVGCSAAACCGCASTHQVPSTHRLIFGFLSVVCCDNFWLESSKFFENWLQRSISELHFCKSPNEVRTPKIVPTLLPTKSAIKKCSTKLFAAARYQACHRCLPLTDTKRHRLHSLSELFYCT